jgi:hypothetical protein
MSLHDDIKSALTNQPYQTNCSECGSTVEVDNTDVDSDFDMLISVVPCPKCIENAVAEAIKEAKGS